MTRMAALAVILFCASPVVASAGQFNQITGSGPNDVPRNWLACKPTRP